MVDDVPNEAAAASNLGVLLALEGDRLRARQLLERAVQLRHTQRERASTQGEVHEAQRAIASTLTNLAGLVQVTEDPKAAMSFYKLVRTCLHVCTRSCPRPHAAVLSKPWQPPLVLSLNVSLYDTGLRDRYCDGARERRPSTRGAQRIQARRSFPWAGVRFVLATERSDDASPHRHPGARGGEPGG
jgi:hypothetical protein